MTAKISANMPYSEYQKLSDGDKQKAIDLAIEELIKRGVVERRRVKA